jgi:hypothetical protein
MHRLRIEFGGKRDDFLTRDVTRSECAVAAWRKIFEGECHHGGLLVRIVGNEA